jgi:hypothetical protein
MMVYYNDVDNVNTGNTLKVLSVRHFSVASSTVGIDSAPTIHYSIMYYMPFLFYNCHYIVALCYSTIQYGIAVLLVVDKNGLHGHGV